MGTKWIRSQDENEVKATKLKKATFIHSFILTLIIFIKKKKFIILFD